MTHDQLAIAADALSTASTLVDRACDRLVRDEDATMLISIARSYIIEAAEAFGMKLVEARQ